MAEKVLTGAIAIIKVINSQGIGTPVGFLRDFRVNESFRRQDVRGIGTILPSESPVVEWAGTISCSFYEIDYKKAGVAGALRRDVGFGNIASQVANGINNINFEDNLILDADGVSLELFKKIKDAVDPNTGLISPNAVPYALITRALIDSDNVTIGENSISGRDQSFRYLDPIVFNA